MARKIPGCSTRQAHILLMVSQTDDDVVIIAYFVFRLKSLNITNNTQDQIVR